MLLYNKPHERYPMENELLKELIAFIHAKTLLSTNVSLGPHSRLFEDVGLTGTDAVEFMLAYGTHFHVDVTSFNSAEYFDDEGVLFSWSARKVLTIADLVLGIEASKLDDTIIQGNGNSKV